MLILLKMLIIIYDTNYYLKFQLLFKILKNMWAQIDLRILQNYT